jgi:alkylhydroperoxidase family enzyme
MSRLIPTLLTLAALAPPCWAADVASDAPKPVPATRPEIKEALEALKQRTPRLPLPASAEQGGANNGRMRALYIPEAWSGGAPSRGGPGRGGRGTPGQRGNNSAPTLDYVLTTSCFWIVSRGNNCHYCLGHQELKLAGAGVADDKIAALDFRWTDFDPRTRAALAYARKLTLEPHLIGDADVEKLQEHFTDNEIIELTFVISRFNSTNRWTDGMGIPQDSSFGEEASTLLTPTSDEFLHTQSQVTADTREPRPAPPSAAEIAAAIEACKSREPRVEIPSIAAAKTMLGDAVAGREPLAWERALSGLPEVGKYQVAAWNTMLTDDHLPPRLKAELAYITAVNNRAWYAAATAAQHLAELGVPSEEYVSLFSDGSHDSPGAAAAYRLAMKSTVDPHLISDRDLAAARAHYSDEETAMIMHVICMANLFDRFTEALGLPVEHGAN